MKKNKLKMYKVLRVENDDGIDKIYSPIQEHYYGELENLLGKESICKDFDESDDSCSNGFYAVQPEGLLYCLNNGQYNKVFEVEMSGKNIKFNQFKHRFEKQTIIRMLNDDELDELLRETDKELDYDFYRAIKPLDPRTVEFKGVDDNVLRLLQQVDYIRDSVWRSVVNSVWKSVVDSVWHSLWNSVERSVWASVWYFVEHSVGDSVMDIMYAYIGSCFPNIKKWKYINHKEGECPFQCYVDLMELGVVPVYNRNYKVWNLYAGGNMKVVYEINRNELKKL